MSCSFPANSPTEFAKSTHQLTLIVVKGSLGVVDSVQFSHHQFVFCYHSGALMRQSVLIHLEGPSGDAVLLLSYREPIATWFELL